MMRARQLHRRAALTFSRPSGRPSPMHCSALLLASLPFALLSPAPLRAQVQWSAVPHMPPFVAAMAWDGGLGAPVMLGGDPYANSHQHLYGPGGRISTLPTPVFHASMAYDPVRDLLVVLSANGGIFEGRTQWTMPSTPPLAGLSNAVVVYDAARATHVIAGYGGQQLRFFDWNGTTAVPRLQVARVTHNYTLQLIHHAAQGRIWVIEQLGAALIASSYDGTSLQPLAGTPPPTTYMRCVYDPVGARLLAFGGNTNVMSSGFVGVATWAFDGAAWTSLGTSPTQPGNGAACTSAQGRALAHAEVVREGGSWIPRPALYEWNGSAWSLVPGSEGVASAPTTLESVPDPSTGRTLLGLWYSRFYTYYGYQTRLWFDWDGQRFTPALAPPGAQFALGALFEFHAGVGRRVAFNYQAGQPSTYHQVGNSWVLMSSSGPPAGPFWGMAWDGTAVILFGSRLSASGFVPETWAWDGAQWTLRVTANAPTARYSPKMAFDASRRRVVLFGGSLGGQPLADTWEWDGVDWVQRASGPTVSQDECSLHWHGKRARCVLHHRAAVDRFWEWNGTAWQQQNVLGTVVPAAGAHLMRAVDGDLLRIGTGVDRYDSAFPASYAAIGAGCAGTAGVPVLDTALHDQPWLGDWITVRVGALPAAAGAAFLLTGFSTTSWAGVPLPLSLAPLGAGPCTLHVAADLTIPLPAANGEATWGTAVPWEPALIGFELHQQALVPDPPANAFGWTLSNAATLRIGRR
jgi:hypothetical protein